MQARSKAATPKTRSTFQTPISSRHASTENIASSVAKKPPIGQSKAKPTNAGM